MWSGRFAEGIVAAMRLKFGRCIGLSILFAVCCLVCLTGCEVKHPPTTDQDAETILRVMAASLEEGEGDALIWLVDTEEAAAYVEDYYGISTPGEVAVVRMAGARAFELAVLRMEDDAVDDALLQYVEGRKVAFYGYAPEQVELLDNALVLSGGEWHVLAVCQEPEKARAALESCFGRGINAHGIPNVLGPSPEDLRPDRRLIFDPPQVEDMTVYDTTAILDAWRSGDASSLARKDRELLSDAEAVLNACIEPGMTDLEKETALYTWLVLHTEYDESHYSKKGAPRVSYEPYGPLVLEKGVCLGYATAFQLLMDMADIECITVIGASSMNGADHAWNMVRLDGSWYCVDPTWEEVNEDSSIKGLYLNVSSDYMAETDHQWDYDSIPET